MDKQVLYEVNNLSISQILKILTQSMKNRKATAQDIAIMQRDFLEQFGIKTGEVFIDASQLNVSNEKNSKDVDDIIDFIKNTKEPRICSQMIWKEALKRNGKPSRLQTQQISLIIEENFEEREKMNTPTRFKKYGTQRYWKKIKAEI